jgi:hypothetical protein
MTFKSQYYQYGELTKSGTALRLDIDNVPNKSQIENLNWLCAKILDPLTNKIGHHLTITSGFRCKALNDAIGGSNSSQHISGQAADVTCAGMTMDVLMNYILNGTNLPYDQLIYELGQWIHISYDHSKTKQRGEVLAAVRENGKTVYKPYKGAA